jgi:hypothetical protein
MPAILFRHPNDRSFQTTAIFAIENNLSPSAAALSPGALARVEFNRFFRLKHQKSFVG